MADFIKKPSLFILSCVLTANYHVVPVMCVIWHCVCCQCECPPAIVTAGRQMWISADVGGPVITHRVCVDNTCDLSKKDKLSSYAVGVQAFHYPLLPPPENSPFDLVVYRIWSVIPLHHKLNVHCHFTMTLFSASLATPACIGAHFFAT